MPGFIFRLSIGLWSNCIVLSYQIVESVLIFAKPVFKKPGIYTSNPYLNTMKNSKPTSPYGRDTNTAYDKRNIKGMQEK